MSGVRTRMTCLALALGLTAALAACGGGAPPGGPVTVLIPWAPGTGEYAAFKAVIGPFERDTGIQVIPESTRALTQQLDADLNVDDAPDIADLPNPGTVNGYQHKGLVPTDVNLSSYEEPWRTLAESASGTVLAIPVKADIKGLLWYNTKTVTHPPANWADLENLSKRGTPWCLGLASGPTSGWPGADWIADLLLSTGQADAYKNWLRGALSWTSHQVRAAWQQWGTLIRDGAAVPGGAPEALTTSFSGAISGQCQLEHGALAAIGLTSTSGYSYVRLPAASDAPSPVMVSGDFMGLFTSNPNARRLLAYLATTPAQRLWVSQPGGHAFSADGAVPPASYPPGVQRQLAALLRPGSGTALCFAAGDTMVPDMTAAFSQAVLDYVSDPASLPTLLRGLQKTEQGAGASPVWNRACATP
ncbi:MAG: extracellular solute-binding protein [Trebonia sp.]